VLEPLAILRADSDSSLYRFSIHVQRQLFATVLVLFNIDHGTVVGIFKDDVNVYGG